MAITPLTSPYKSLTFDGETSASYGVQILGEGVFNAPERDVEMIEIPGRNGAYALDKGRFQNIEVTYPANLIANSTTDFSDGISNFRNFLCSKKGYVRLTDDYNPNEYRMAVYKSGLEVDEKVLRAGEFDITFECKPQRWLTSGETKTTIATSGDTITNPTLFDASPMLEVEGYGTIGFNGYEIELDNAQLGEIQLSSAVSSNKSTSLTLTTTNLNASDAIYVNDNALINSRLTMSGHTGFTDCSVSSSTNAIDAYCTLSSAKVAMFYLVPDLSTGFVYGTSSTITSSAVYSYTPYGGSASTETISVSFAYDGADTITVSITRTGTLPTGVSRSSTVSQSIPAFYGDSTKSLLGNPTYIDCDLGECYRIDSGTTTSLNQHIDLGSDLPKLASGSNTITFDNTITDLQITPRWWKV